MKFENTKNHFSQQRKNLKAQFQVFCLSGGAMFHKLDASFSFVITQVVISTDIHQCKYTFSTVELPKQCPVTGFLLGDSLK